MSLEHFKRSPEGRRLAGLLNSESAIHRMESKSRASRPAVEAIGKDVQAKVGVLDDEAKKMVGRWVKDILTTRGWQPDRKGRVAPGHFFARGTIYRRAGEPQRPGSGAARLASARALVRKLPQRPLDVDAFLSDRPGMWGR